MNSKTLLQLLELLDKDPEDAKKEISELFSSISPVVLELYDGAIRILDEISKDKRSAEIFARLHKNKFDALVEVGFTKPQAMEILLKNEWTVGNFINKNN